MMSCKSFHWYPGNIKFRENIETGACSIPWLLAHKNNLLMASPRTGDSIKCGHLNTEHFVHAQCFFTTATRSLYQRSPWMKRTRSGHYRHGWWFHHASQVLRGLEPEPYRNHKTEQWVVDPCWLLISLCTNMYIYVIIYIYTCICTCTWNIVYMYMYMYMCVHEIYMKNIAYIYILYMETYIYIHIHINIYIYICTYRMCICVIYIYISIRMFT